MKLITSAYHTLRFWTLITLLSILFGILGILARTVDWRGNTSHKISSAWCRLMCVLNGVRVEISGLENIYRDRAQVFVANHQGYFDIFSLSGYLPVQIRWMAKESLFRIPFVGWAMRASGYIGVNRSNRKSAYKAFMQTIETLKKGNSVVIFPEGTRSLDGKVAPFKKGSQLLAIRSHCPMVPVTIIGSGQIIKKGSATFQPHPVRIIISRPIEWAELEAENEEAVLEHIRDTIRANLVQMSATG